jgi:hypothetical protein
MPLMVTCRFCRKEFRAGIQMDEAGLNDPSNQVIDFDDQCPHCGKITTHGKEALHWQKARGQ